MVCMDRKFTGTFSIYENKLFICIHSKPYIETRFNIKLLNQNPMKSSLNSLLFS